MTATPNTLKSATKARKPRKKKTTIASQLFSNLHVQQKQKEIRCMREGVGLDANLEHTGLDTAEAITWPDINGNYMMLSKNKYVFIDRYGEKIWPEAFDTLLSYSDDLYIARMGNRLFFIDASSGELFFLDEKTGELKSQTADGAETIYHHEKLNEIKDKILQLHSKMHPDVLQKIFKSVLYQFEVDFVSSDPDEVFSNSRKISKNYKKLFHALHGVYRYFYHGEITPSLAGVNSELRPELFKSPFLKERLPDLYLAMHELQNVKEVLIDPKGKVLGYVEKKWEKYGYKTPDQKRVEGVMFDDFRGPDTQGNIITKIGQKEYFINENFLDREIGFDSITDADAGGNYLALLDAQHYLIKGDGSFFKMPNFGSWSYESRGTNAFEEIQPLDKNGNYLVYHKAGSFLLNQNAQVISSNYLEISPLDQNDVYPVIDKDGATLLDATGKELLSQKHDKIQALEDGVYKVFLWGKCGLFIAKTTTYIPCEYDTIELLHKGTYQVSAWEERGRIDAQGNITIPLNTYQCIEDQDENWLYKVSKITIKDLATNVIHGMVAPTGKEIIPCEFDRIAIRKTAAGKHKPYVATKHGVEMNYTHEGIFFTYDSIADESRLKRIHLHLLRSKKRDFVDEADKHGLFKVWIRHTEAKETTNGLMKDIDTEIIPCEYDKIMLRADGKYVASLPDKDHIFDHEWTMRDCAFNPDGEKILLQKELKARYQEIVNSWGRDRVNQADQNGLFVVGKLEEWRINYGLLKDAETTIIPCTYDKVSLGTDGKYVAAQLDQDHIFDPEGNMLRSEINPARAQIFYQKELKARYQEILASWDRDDIREADQNGLFVVGKLEGWRIHYGLLKDKNTEMLPCKYDRIMRVSQENYKVRQGNETFIKKMKK